MRTDRRGPSPLGTLFSSQVVGTWLPYPNCTVLGTEGGLALGGPYGALTLHRPDAFAVMIGRYLDTILDGTSSPSPGEAGREDLRVVLAAYESERVGREIVLESPAPAS